MEADFPFAHPQVSGDGIASTSTTYENKILRVNLAPMRGREATLRVSLNNSVAGKTTDFVINANQAGHRWEPQPLPGTYWDGFGFVPNIPISDDWQRWAAAGRLQGALLSSAWWHRLTKRDLDLQCRQMSQREFSFTENSGSPLFGQAIGDSRIGLYQPKGMGASGGQIVAYIQISNALTIPSNLKVDYTDQPDGTVSQVSGVGNGKYQLTRPARADRDGTMVEIGLFGASARAGIIYSCAGDDCHKMRWEV
jgi:hypothetical protein